jgi:hypothetical protein
MKNILLRFIRLSLLTALAATMGGSAFAWQPRMQAALQSLLAARAELEQASTNKGGERLAAIRAIDHAIAQTRAGEAYAKKY